MVPYGRQLIEADDEAAILAVVRSDFLTGAGRPAPSRKRWRLASRRSLLRRGVERNGSPSLGLCGARPF